MTSARDLPARPAPDPRAVEWGRRQADAAPPWSDAKWRRVCAILRVDADRGTEVART